MRPGHSPVHLISTRPKEIRQRLLAFSPNQIARVFLFVGSNQFFELLLGQLELCRVRCLGSCLRAPQGVSQTKANPTDFRCRQSGLAHLGIDVIGARVRAGSIFLLGPGFNLGIVRLLSRDNLSSKMCDVKQQAQQAYRGDRQGKGENSPQF